MSLGTWSLIVFSVSLGVAGQLLMKRSMLAFPNLGLDVSVLVRVILQPYVLAGFVCYGLAALSWLLVLSRAPVSVAYPMLSFGYAAVAVLSWLFFGEPLSMAKVIGILAILGGITLLSQA